MAEISVSDAAFAGFRLVREHPGAVAVWTAARLVIDLTFGVGLVAFMGPAFMQAQGLQASGAANPATSAAVLRLMGPILLLVVPYMLVLLAIAVAAVNRAVLQPENSRFAYLRLGMDEVRQGLLTLLSWLVAFGLYIGLIVISIIIGVLVGVVIGLATRSMGGMAKPALAAIVGLVVFAPLVCVEVFVWVRLSLAWALTFDRGRVNLFGSWALTRGRFWRIFGVYLLAMIFCVILAVLMLVIDMSIGFAGGGGMAGLRSFLRPDMSSLGAYLTPARIAVTVISAIGNTLIWLILLAPAAEIYRRLQPPDREASVFA